MTGVLYWNTLGNQPVWDDNFYIISQPFLHQCRNLLTVLNPRYLFQVLPVRNAARPVWLASVLVDSCLHGTSYLGFRLTNILWFAAGAVMVFSLVLRLTRERNLAALSALLFLNHPIHTESVNLIAFRSDLMAFVFLLGAFLCYLNAREARGRTFMAWIGCSLLAFILAMMSKESAVILPGILLLGDIIFPFALPPKKKVQRWRRAMTYGAFIVACLTYLVFRMPRSGYLVGSDMDLFSSLNQDLQNFQPQAAPGFIPPPRQKWDPPPWHRVYESHAVRFRTMSKIFGSYLCLLVWPYPLQGDYAPKPVEAWRDFGVLASLAAWLSLMILGWRIRRSQPLISFGLFWLPIALAPVSGLILIRNLQADRYLYIASAGFCVALAAFLCGGSLERIGIKKRTGFILGVSLALIYGMLTIARNRDYKDNLVYYSSIVRQDPEVPRARFNLGTEYENREQWAEAEIQYREGLKLWPETVQGHILLASLLIDRWRVREGLQELDVAEKYAPGDATILDIRTQAEALLKRNPKESYARGESRQ